MINSVLLINGWTCSFFKILPKNRTGFLSCCLWSWLHPLLSISVRESPCPLQAFFSLSNDCFYKKTMLLHPSALSVLSTKMLWHQQFLVYSHILSLNRFMKQTQKVSCHSQGSIFISWWVLGLLLTKSTFMFHLHIAPTKQLPSPTLWCQLLPYSMQGTQVLGKQGFCKVLFPSLCLPG